MLAGLYAVIMLIGLWSLSLLVFKLKTTTLVFYKHILPVNTCFWLFVSIPLLAQMIYPQIEKSILELLFYVISLSFIMTIPFMIEKLLGRHCLSLIWVSVGSLLICLFLISTIFPEINNLTKNSYTVVYLIFFIYFFYIRLSTKLTQSLESIYLNRFFIATLCFFPSIVMDISGFSFAYLNIVCTPFFYLAIVAIIFTLPEIKNLHQHLDGNSDYEKIYKFTKREIEIIKGLIKGNSNKDIASTLFISESTVKRHLHNIFKKANCKSRFELIQKLNK